MRTYFNPIMNAHFPNKVNGGQKMKEIKLPIQNLIAGCFVCFVAGWISCMLVVHFL